MNPYGAAPFFAAVSGGFFFDDAYAPTETATVLGSCASISAAAPFAPARSGSSPKNDFPQFLAEAKSAPLDRKAGTRQCICDSVQVPSTKPLGLKCERPWGPLREHKLLYSHGSYFSRVKASFAVTVVVPASKSSLTRSEPRSVKRRRCVYCVANQHTLPPGRSRRPYRGLYPHVAHRVTLAKRHRHEVSLRTGS